MKKAKLIRSTIVTSIIAGVISMPVLADTKIRLRPGHNFVVEDRATSTDNMVIQTNGGVSIPRGGLDITGGGLAIDAVRNSAGIITEAEQIINNDNDITIPTSAAIIDYVQNNSNNAGAGAASVAQLQFVKNNLAGTLFVKPVYLGDAHRMSCDNTSVCKVEQDGVYRVDMRVNNIASINEECSMGFAEDGATSYNELLHAVTGHKLISVKLEGEAKQQTISNSKEFFLMTGMKYTFKLLPNDASSQKCYFGKDSIDTRASITYVGK